jgi:hypothetical protein
MYSTSWLFQSGSGVRSSSKMPAVESASRVRRVSDGPRKRTPCCVSIPASTVLEHAQRFVGAPLTARVHRFSSEAAVSPPLLSQAAIDAGSRAEGFAPYELGRTCGTRGLSMDDRFAGQRRHRRTNGRPPLGIERRARRSVSCPRCRHSSGCWADHPPSAERPIDGCQRAGHQQRQARIRPNDPLDLEISEDGAVLGRVEDGGHGRVAVRENVNPADGGMGLRLVDAYTDRWGVEEGTTNVWFKVAPRRFGPP